MANISPNRSFKGFNVLELVKRQKKVIIGALGYLIGMLTTNNEMIASGSALAFGLIISSIEFYFKRVDARTI